MSVFPPQGLLLLLLLLLFFFFLIVVVVVVAVVVVGTRGNCYCKMKKKVSVSLLSDGSVQLQTVFALRHSLNHSSEGIWRGLGHITPMTLASVESVGFHIWELLDLFRAQTSWLFTRFIYTEWHWECDDFNHQRVMIVINHLVDFTWCRRSPNISLLILYMGIPFHLRYQS